MACSLQLGAINLVPLHKKTGMKFKVGDKVKFLNESGGGIITRIVNSKMVHVAIEDGFDIPTLTSELLKIENLSGPGKFFDETYNVEIPVQENHTQAAEQEERVSGLSVLRSQNIFSPGIFLAFVPQEQKWLITGDLDIYLINHTGFDILFSFFLLDSKGIYHGLDYDAIPAESKILLQTISREEIEKWSEGVVQLLLHKEEANKLLLPVNSAFRIKSTKFFKETSYVECSFLQETAFLAKLPLLQDSRSLSNNEIDQKHERNKAQVSQAVQAKPEALIDRHKITPRMAEVDLHISALREDYNQLDKHEILQIQTGYFNRCLNSALENQFFKVYFIHGVGNGTLKKAIQDELNEYGDDIQYQDAPFNKYGSGAVEVMLLDNL